MARGLLQLVVPALLLTLAPRAPAQGADDPRGEVIQDVVIDGNVGVDRRLLLANLGTRVGTPYDPAVVEQDIVWMHDTYGIIVEETYLDPGPVVRFELLRIRQYEFVEFQGNDRFSDETLRGVARLRADRGATPDEVSNAQRLVRDHYVEDGYHFAQVDVRFDERPDGSRGAILRVYEGPEVEIDDLFIEGLTALDEGDARGLLRSTPGFWGTLLGKDFVRKELDRDVVLLEAFVRGEGYLDARVAIGDLSWSPDREEVDITLLVEEGPRYVVRSQTVVGNLAIPTDELLEAARLAVGRPYRGPDVARTRRAIEDAYGHLGYIDCEVHPEETFDLEEPVVDVVWRVDEGDQKKVRDVIVRGNTGTRDGVVRRYLTVRPGDVVDTRELRYSEDALVALNYFTDLTGIPKVRVSTRPTPDPEYVDVYVDVDDSSSGLFSFIIGAGSDSGLFGGITIDKRNFDISRSASSPSRFLREFFGTGQAYHGGGQRLYAEIVPGTETTDFNISFQDPWLDESREDPWGVSVNLYDNRRIFDDYDQERQGVGVFFDHRLSRETSVSIGPRIENVDISNVDDRRRDTVTGLQTEFAQAEGSHRRQVLEGSWRYQDVDSLFEPTDGHTHRLRLELVGGPLGGDVDAVRTQWISEGFFPLGEDEDGNIRVLNPRLALGWVEDISSDDDLPFFEHFFAGGATGPFAVRGFDYQGVGPHQEIRRVNGQNVLVDDDGDAVGGQLAAVASLQALFPLVTEYNPFRDRDETIVKGVLFLDAGNVLPEPRLGDLGSDVRLATGAGARLRLPALGGVTILLDYAFVLREEDGDETRALSFELSRRF